MGRVTRSSRAQALLQVQSRLERESFPRVQMALIVAVTGAAGLLASFLLLHAGVDAMAWRYPAALVAAYAVFLLLLWAWLRTNAEDYADLGNLATDLTPPGGARWTPGGGGDFAGGGASASFDEAAVLPRAAATTASDSAGSLLDGDDIAIPLVVVALAIGLAFASLYIVYAAPALLAELLFDGLLSYTLYRRLRGVERRQWLSTAVRRTAPAFAATAVFLVVMGWAMAAYAPGAHSIGEVLRHASAAKR